MPSKQLTAPIFEQLALHPEGIPAKHIAKILGWTEVKASHLMGKMFFAGQIDRRPAGAGVTRRNNAFIYTLKPKVEAPTRSPPTQPARSPAPLRPLPAWAREYAELADSLSAID